MSGLIEETGTQRISLLQLHSAGVQKTFLHGSPAKTGSEHGKDLFPLDFRFSPRERKRSSPQNQTRQGDFEGG